MANNILNGLEFIHLFTQIAEVRDASVHFIKQISYKPMFSDDNNYYPKATTYQPQK